MLTKSKFLKTTILAALVGLTAAAAVTPASAHEFGGYHRDRDSHRGWRGHEHGYWGFRHFHRHHGWY